jgi:hypothetical protein
VQLSWVGPLNNTGGGEVRKVLGVSARGASATTCRSTSRRSRRSNTNVACVGPLALLKPQSATAPAPPLVSGARTHTWQLRSTDLLMRIN